MYACLLGAVVPMTAGQVEPSLCTLGAVVMIPDNQISRV